MSCLLLTESSHDMLESSRYIPRDRSQMHTAELDLNLGSVMAPKRLTTLKSVPLMLDRNPFERRVGQ